MGIAAGIQGQQALRLGVALFKPGTQAAVASAADEPFLLGRNSTGNELAQLSVNRMSELGQPSVNRKYDDSVEILQEKT